MVQVDLDKVEIPGASGASGAPNILKESSGYLGDIIKLVSQGKELMGHVATIVDTLKGNPEGSGNSGITRSDMALKSPVDVPTNPPVEQKGMSDKDMENFVMSPEGVKKIVEAIDKKIIPIMGDVKLSELRNALVGAPKEEPKKTNVPKEKIKNDR